MTMNITNFRNQLGRGGARPNQFRVILTYPNVVGGGPGEQTLLVTGASLPASNVSPTIVQYRGREVKLAGERTFDPWTVTIMNDTSMKLRKDFEFWSDAVNSRQTNGGELTPSSYMTQLYVDQLDRNDSVIRSYTITDAFPSLVSEVALQYGQNDVVSEFQVTFQYQTFSVTP